MSRVPSPETKPDDGKPPYEAPRVTWEERVDVASLAVACNKSDPIGECEGFPVSS
jgi:hypothetical protein